MNFKKKAISSLFWSIIENFSKIGLQFVIGLILARILEPSQFGIIGLVTVFIALSNTFVDSGFSQSLIRKQNCTEVDYSTVFLFNISISSLFYFLIYIIAPTIADFYDQPILTNITRVYSFILILQSFSLIQRTTLTKDLDFKYQSKVTAISASSAGVLAIYMAFHGFGVWSLVFKQLFEQLLINVLLWKKKRWQLKLKFNIDIFKEHFSFGYKMLLSGLLYQFFQNIYILMIGKVFSVSTLGFYSKAKNFANLPSISITSIIDRVSYPILAKMQESDLMLLKGYNHLIKHSTYVVFLLMLFLASISDNLVIVLIGKKWLTTAEYLRIICFASMLYPLHSLNLNVLKVKGRSDLFLKLEIIKKIVILPTLIIGYFLGIKIMLYTMVFNSYFSFFLNTLYSEKLINYSCLKQIKDIFPNLFLGYLIYLITFGFGYFVKANVYITLVSQIFIFMGLTFGLSIFLKNESFYYIKNILYSYKDKILRKSYV